MPLTNPSGGSWINASLGSSYGAAGSSLLVPGYRRDVAGIVFLKGSATYISGNAGLILTLPLGFRPTGTCRFIVFGADTGGGVATTFVSMQSNGQLVWSAGGYTVISFDQIFFATY